VVDPPAVDEPADPDEVAPDEFAVPAALVPGAVGVFAALPAPLGSFDELFRPPALAGPLGTPLTPAVPAPAEPAFGEPAAVPVPADGPLAAPPAEAPPADPPPVPPPEPPPPLCAKAASGHISAITMANLCGLGFCIVVTLVNACLQGNAVPFHLVPDAERIVAAIRQVSAPRALSCEWRASAVGLVADPTQERAPAFRIDLKSFGLLHIGWAGID
jgi:hypothetical protein